MHVSRHAISCIDVISVDLPLGMDEESKASVSAVIERAGEVSAPYGKTGTVYTICDGLHFTVS